MRTLLALAALAVLASSCGRRAPLRVPPPPEEAPAAAEAPQADREEPAAP